MKVAIILIVVSKIRDCSKPFAEDNFDKRQMVLSYKHSEICRKLSGI